MMDTEYREIEVRFLDVDKKLLEEKLLSLGAKDKGEDFLKNPFFVMPHVHGMTIKNSFGCVKAHTEFS